MEPVRARLTAQTRLLPDPPLWCWEIVDARGAVLASSWESEWSAYPSSDEALRRATPTLRAMTRRLGGRTATGRVARPREEAS